MADPDRPDDEQETERFDHEGPRSIFSAFWFRAVLVVVVLGVVAAVAVPYVLEWVNPPPPTPTLAARPASTPTRPPTAPPAVIAPVPAAPTAPVAVPPPVPAPAQPPAVATPSPAPPPAPVAPPKKAAPAKSAAVKEPAPRPVRAAAKATAGTGSYFVQVGAFKDPEAAKRLAARLRTLKFNVDESSTSAVQRTGADTASPAPPGGGPAPTGSDKYDVYVAGGAPADINAKLAAKGLASEPSGGSVVVKPSLPLRDAVALSKDLAVEGFKVQVRRAGAGVPAAASTPAVAPPVSAATAVGETLYRVRVGPFADRPAATAALRDLEERGYKPFIARGGDLSP